MTKISSISMRFGGSGCFECDVAAERTSAWHVPPAALDDVRAEIRSALRSPIDFPPLEQAVLADDRVTLALDRDTPHAGELIAEVWDVLQRAGVRPENVAIVQPPSLQRGTLGDPRAELSGEAAQMRWLVHDPTEESLCRYLATTIGGERIYLSRELADADVVVAIGQTAYDAVLGFRGTNSVFYPGLSTADAFLRTHGQGHSELEPEDERPLRQLVDEVGWLLGTQFALQVAASAGAGVSAVFAGAGESVFRRARQFVADHWSIHLDERPDIVVVAVDQDAGGHGWRQAGAALETARNLVRRGGRIVLLSELDAELGPGLELLQASGNPRDALQPIRAAAPPDLLPATQLAMAVDWADVYFLSRLESDVVEDLFMIPLANTKEACRALSGDETCAFIASAQHVYGTIRG